MNLYKYLCEKTIGHAYELDLLKFEIEKQIYYYGDHFRNHSERAAADVLASGSQPRDNEFFLTKNVRRLMEVATRVANFQCSSPVFAKDSKKNDQSRTRDRIVMKGYFNSLYSAQVLAAGYAIEGPAYDDLGFLDSEEQRILLRRLAELLANPGICLLLSDELFDLIASAKAVLLECYRRISYKGVFVPYDIPFWERLVIDVFKDLGKPAVIYIHGIPGIYNSIDYNRGNYIIVWGEKIKQNFIMQGVPASKIFVFGNPKLSSKRKSATKRASFEDVLIITKAAPGAQYGDTATLYDRGNLLVYMYMVQEVLTGMNVKSVRFRPHPSENPEWYLKNMNTQFFSLDERQLSTSLKQASLVIGPSSTVLFDSIMQGTPYLLFEPSANGVDLINYRLVDPFDGRNPRVPLATNENELRYFLMNNILVDPDVLPEYCSDESDLDSFLSRLR